MEADLWWREWREWLGLRTVGAGLVPPGAGSRGGQVVWGHWDGDRAACAFFCRAAAAAAGRGEADPGGAGGGGGGVRAVGQQLGAGHQPHRAQGHRGTAGRCAGPDRAGGRTVRGGGPRQRPGRAGPGGRRGRGAAAGSGDRFPVPRAEPCSGSRTRRSSSAGKRPPPRCWSGCRGTLAGAGLLVVSGASGAGKSSLLRAGVLPRIRAAGLAAAPGAASWPCLVFTPTRAPLDELALRVALLAGADAAAVRRGLDGRSGGVRPHRAAGRPGAATRAGRGCGRPRG